MRRWMVGLLCVLLAGPAFAGASAIAVRKTAEASMLVNGWIEVAPDGSVHSYTIDRPEKIPSPVADLISKSVPNWKFHFDDPVNAIQRARMHLRIKASPIDDQHASIAVCGATFGDGNNMMSTDRVHYKDRNQTPPEYPHEAIVARVTGTVYLILRVNRQGKVEDAAAEQVNLTVYSSEAQMQRFREMLANAAVKAAKRWTYALPTTGKHVADAHWDIRVPITYTLGVDTSEKDTYGKWQSYIPGPREQVPWRTQAQIASSIDALPDGSISQVDDSMQLTTTLAGA